MIEVEIMDDDAEPREFADVMREFRKRVVMQEKGNLTLRVKTHLDDMVNNIFYCRISIRVINFF